MATEARYVLLSCFPCKNRWTACVCVLLCDLARCPYTSHHRDQGVATATYDEVEVAVDCEEPWTLESGAAETDVSAGTSVDFDITVSHPPAGFIWCDRALADARDSFLYT